jgi:hypothetical protein
VLLFPLSATLIPETVIISLFALFVTERVIAAEPSLKGYLALFACLAFLTLWRVDIGYPSILASVITLLIYKLNAAEFRIDWKLLLKTLAGFFAVIVFLLMVLGWIRGINVFAELRAGLNYLASSQSYGITSLGDATLTAYKMQYFIFPLLMLLFGGVLLVFFRNFQGPQRFVYLALLFLTVFYFVNFQRGLVRHSFYEGSDTRVSQYLFFVISGSIYLFFRERSAVFRFFAFMSLSVFLVMAFAYPSPTSFTSIYSSFVRKSVSFPVIEPHGDMERCIDTAGFEEKNFGEFKTVIKEYLGKNQTFIDFANLPMLYYFTGKVSPSYFYQNPLSIHNDFLQEKFLRELSHYDAPLLVFSGFPERWWDNVDGVPNTMRHYRMAEYFYRNYEPFIIADRLCIWKRKGEAFSNFAAPRFVYAPGDSLKDEIRCNIPEKKNGRKYLVTVSHKGTPPKLNIRWPGGKTEELAPEYTSEEKKRSFYVLPETNQSLKLSMPVEGVSLMQVDEYDHLPDFYSDAFRKQDLLLLPNIWASYDKEWKDERELCHRPATANDSALNSWQMDIDPFVDKASGNTLCFSVSSRNENEDFFDIRFMNHAGICRGEYFCMIPPGAGDKDFAVRISSQYNWYEGDIDQVSVKLLSDKKIRLKQMKLLKGG